MILYFSATGNSRFTAQRLAARMPGETLVDLRQWFHQKKPWTFRSDTPFVLVCPIYAWRLPLALEDFLRRAELAGSRELYVVATMGAGCGDAARYARQAAESRGLRWMGFAGIVMPDNYLPMFKMPDPAEAAGIVRAAEPRIEAVGRPAPAAPAGPGPGGGAAVRAGERRLQPVRPGPEGLCRLAGVHPLRPLPGGLPHRQHHRTGRPDHLRTRLLVLPGLPAQLPGPCHRLAGQGGPQRVLHLPGRAGRVSGRSQQPCRNCSTSRYTALRSRSLSSSWRRPG